MMRFAVRGFRLRLIAHACVEASKFLGGSLGEFPRLREAQDCGHISQVNVGGFTSVRSLGGLC